LLGGSGLRYVYIETKKMDLKKRARNDDIQGIKNAKNKKKKPGTSDIDGRFGGFWVKNLKF